MTAADFFLVSYEAKDRLCLETFGPGLADAGARVRSLDIYQELGWSDGATLRAFLDSPFPVAVIASVSAGDVLRTLRPPDTFLCIGVEHGFAPFKRYTYGRSLLQADYYLAPTRGWAERLVRLHPDQRAKVRLGGYPKLEAMRQLVGTALPTADDEAPSGQSGKMLVILSWGVDQAALSRLPDHGFIDYLLHPADRHKVSADCLTQARVHVSRPELTMRLIADAEAIVGDFSSLTLECLYLGKPVHFLFDRSLYAGACDVDEEFLDRESAEFGRIPFSAERILPACTMDAEAFRQAIDADGDLVAFQARAPLARFPVSFMPPEPGANQHCGVAEMLKIVEEETARRAALPVAGTARADSRAVLNDVKLITRIYHSALGRAPDLKGLQHYRRMLGAKSERSCADAATIAAQLCDSPEARKRAGEVEANALAKGLRALAEASSPQAHASRS